MKDVLWIEFRKVIRSKLPIFTVLGFFMIPVACSFIMFVYRDPEFARKAGLISAKANLMGGKADWMTYLNMLYQSMAIVGIILFSFIQSWMFGREFVDGTIKDLLAVPVARFTILAAKFIVAGIWSAALALLVYLAGMAMGFIVGLPYVPLQVIVTGSVTFLVTSCLVIFTMPPFALIASIGRGYMLPFGFSVFVLAFAQILGLMGWGEFFPWAIPAMYANMGNKPITITPFSYSIVILTAVAGIYGTYVWWKYADQSR